MNRESHFNTQSQRTITMVQPRTRLKIANRMIHGWSYADIADDLDVSEYRVSKVVNEYGVDPEDDADPDEMALNLYMSGIPDMLAYDEMLQ